MSLQQESTIKISDGFAVASDILSAYDLNARVFNTSQKRKLMQCVNDARRAMERYGEDGVGARPNTIGVWEYWLQHQDWKAHANSLRKLAIKRPARAKKSRVEKKKPSTHTVVDPQL